MNDNTIISRARAVLDTEIASLQSTRDTLEQPFTDTIRMLDRTLENCGKIVVTGVGKSLHIAEKISATLASTGSTSIVMNPIQAMHGDLGMIAKQDVLLAISFSGESDELLKLIPAVRRLGISVIGMVGNVSSTLARLSDQILPVAITTEACPFGMAPTSSTTATMALGDALAMVLLDLRHFNKERYACLHPAGAIGRALILLVRDIMRQGDQMATLTSKATVKDAIMAMTAAKSGAALIQDAQGCLSGIFTDGDLRRMLIEGRTVLEQPITSVMTQNPITIEASAYAVDALKVFEQYKIDDLPVVDHERKLLGYVDLQDLPKMKVL